MPNNTQFHIPEIPQNIPAEGLTDAVAFGTGQNESPERYKISFEYYINKKCGIDNIEQKSHAIKALRWFRDVAQCSDEEGLKSIADKINDKAICNANDYAFLFAKLPEEFHDGVREYKLSSGRGRIFYCIDAARKIVYCILIHQAHLETNKNRR